MRHPIRISATAIGLFVLTLATIATAQSEDYPPCGTFTLSSGAREITAIDLGEKGESIGDERLGERGLIDAAGNRVGMLRWVSQVVDIEKDGADDDIALVQSAFFLPDGALHVIGQVRYEDILDEGNQASKRNSIVVVGGTGAYLHSGGEILVSPGSPGQIEFRLHCD